MVAVNESALLTSLEILASVNFTWEVPGSCMTVLTLSVVAVIRYIMTPFLAMHNIHGFLHNRVVLKKPQVNMPARMPNTAIYTKGLSTRTFMQKGPGAGIWWPYRPYPTPGKQLETPCYTVSSFHLNVTDEPATVTALSPGWSCTDKRISLVPTDWVTPPIWIVAVPLLVFA